MYFQDGLHCSYRPDRRTPWCLFSRHQIAQAREEEQEVKEKQEERGSWIGIVEQQRRSLK